MPYVKGQSGNPGGQNIAALRLKRMIEGLGPRAVAKLERLLDGDNDALAFQAAKEILSRVAPVPKHGTMLVQHSASPHLAALVGLATATAARVIDNEPDMAIVGAVGASASADGASASASASADGASASADGASGPSAPHLIGESEAPGPDIPAESC